MHAMGFGRLLRRSWHAVWVPGRCAREPPQTSVFVRAQAALLLGIASRAPAVMLRTASRAWAALLWVVGACVCALALSRLVDRLPALLLVLLSPEGPRLL